ncbi:MAG: amino acid carrier protein [Planctomycetota bacterium]
MDLTWLWDGLNTANGIIWHNYVLYIVLAVGVMFTIRSFFGQYRALTHGVSVVRGKYDDKDDPGAINHFQALSAALSATVGLGNIAGVGLAVALGGPGAIFWMWMVGLFGMAIKMTEVTLSMLYRNTDNPDEPHGGPMFVAAKGFQEWGLGGVGKVVGGIFVITLLVSTVTGGNMFQAWSVGEITENYFQIPSKFTGIILAVAVGLVIVGGIKRIGAVAGRIVPIMCAIYFLAAVAVLLMNIQAVPGLLVRIVVEAFTPSEASGAFLGGTAGYALLWGMKRALFSSEAGQGSSPIAHSAAKTDEPVREGVVAGLEPFVDTIVVCTLTALVILSSGAFDRGPEINLGDGVEIEIVEYDKDGDGVQETDKDGVPKWIVQTTGAEPKRTDAAVDVSGALLGGEDVFVIVEAQENPNTGLNLHKMFGKLQITGEDRIRSIEWAEHDGQELAFASPERPIPQRSGDGVDLYVDYPGPSLTGHAFDREVPGLGKWLVTLSAWLFALSTAISWSYYGEQGIVFLVGEKGVLPYKLVYCLLIVVAAWGFIKTDAQLDGLTALGTGVMLWANIPIMVIFGSKAMTAYHNYMGRLKSGELDVDAHEPASITDVVEGKDVE